LLRGENSDVFIAGGSRRTVCELCTARATHEGWIREGLDLTAGTRRAGSGRRRSLLSRLRGGNGNGRYDDLPPGGAEELYDAPAAPPVEQAPVLEEPAYEPPREPRNVRAVPTNADLKMSRALELFNASDHPRKVAAVARSLGQPIVAVRPSETEGSVVSITVAWELSWYRYELDLADESAGVRLIDQGTHLDELGDDERLANAAADERGELQLA
ncbi:MAG: hypothetical protein QOJ22_222, partial [Thermoleophilaceae bacterium]|nr:hypothetical protein [Thermoleophilaceae bacterium]